MRFFSVLVGLALHVADCAPATLFKDVQTTLTPNVTAQGAQCGAAAPRATSRGRGRLRSEDSIDVL